MHDSSITTASVRTMVDRFYERVREDAVLGPVFEQQLAGKWHEHMPRMYAFWTKVLLGEGEFQGNVFGKHMALSGIGKEHFIHWLALFRLTVHEVFDTEDTADILEVAERIAGILQLGYFRRTSCVTVPAFQASEHAKQQQEEEQRQYDGDEDRAETAKTV